MMGMGRAMTKTPLTAQQVPMILPNPVIGAMSPYPTVVMVMMAHLIHLVSKLKFFLFVVTRN
jgi:hypothetical protein